MGSKNPKTLEIPWKNALEARVGIGEENRSNRQENARFPWAFKHLRPPSGALQITVSLSLSLSLTMPRLRANHISLCP